MASTKKPKEGEPRAIISGVKVYCAFDEAVPVEALIPNPRNPNDHPVVQVELLGKIIKVNGWRAPVTVSKRSGFVVRGHGRLMAAISAGLAKVPVEYQEYASEAEEYADLVADNRIAELSELSMPKVRELLQEIDTGEIDLELSGFAGDDLAKLMAWAPDGSHMPDNLPDPPATGEDDTMGKLILVYETPEERERWLKIMGISGTNNQVVFSFADLEEEKKPEEAKE